MVWLGVNSSRLLTDRPSVGAAPCAYSLQQLALGRAIAEQLVTLLAEKATNHRDMVIAFLEDQPARYETRSPLVVVRSVLPAVRGNVLLRDAVDDGANPRPYARTGAHRTGLVS